MKSKGPALTVLRSCQGCEHEESDYYAVQGDSGHKVYCTHSGERRRIGDTTWSTPDWCPYLSAPAADLGRRGGMALPVTFRTLGDPITIEEARVDGYGCFDAATGYIAIHPDQHPVGKLITLVHEALHVGEATLGIEVEHDFVESAAFGVAVVLIEAGAAAGLTHDDVRAFLGEHAERAEAGCPCETDVEEPGPHLPSCPWSDPDYDGGGFP